MNRSADWLHQACVDQELAGMNAAAGHHEWACFACHQGVENALKAQHLQHGEQPTGVDPRPIYPACSARQQGHAFGSGRRLQGLVAAGQGQAAAQRQLQIGSVVTGEAVAACQGQRVVPGAGGPALFSRPAQGGLSSKR